MPRYLYTVTDIFQLTGPFLIPTPGIPDNVAGIRKGTRLQLRRPDGSVISTSIYCFFMSSRRDPTRRIISLPRDLTKQDVPLGTEVWLDEESDAD